MPGIKKILYQLWSLSKKINIVNKYGIYPLILLIDLLDSLEKEHQFNNENFSRLLNLLLYILIKSLKIDSIQTGSLEKIEYLLTKYNKS